MKKKLAIAFCLHHKPWLIMSTLLTVMVQDYQDFDIFFLCQQGDGTHYHGRKYAGEFEEYYDLVKRCGINRQLDSYDPRVLEVTPLKEKVCQTLIFPNDHALDSGAWYKFIRGGLWREYDYVLFMGEGALLTSSTVLKDTLAFAKEKGLHFITGSQEKRRIAKDVVLNGFASSKTKNEMTRFHDRMIAETFSIFSRDKSFQKIVDKWRAVFPTAQEHHVPDIWGSKGWWMKAITVFYPVRNIKDRGLTKIRKNVFSRLRFLFRISSSLLSAVALMWARVRPLSASRQKNDDYIYVNGKRKPLKEVVDCQQQGGVKFHKGDDVAWFGATCNHFVSREFLEKFSEKCERYHIYDVLDLPFSATALEIIWGLIPEWAGVEKWFFNGIHRVRKNFTNYRREDDAEGMARYLNRYYGGQFRVQDEGDFIKIKAFHPKWADLKKKFNHFYF